MGKTIYPTLLQISNITELETYSWFDIKRRKGKGRKKKKKYKYKYIYTKKIRLTLDPTQKNIIKKWLDECIDVYNITNEYIKSNLNNDYSNFKNVVNFYNLRKILGDRLKNICKNNNLNKHTADYSVKHCVEMYKSAYSNFKHKHIKEFEIKDLNKERRRKNLIIEPNSVSKTKNSIFVKQLKELKSNIPLNIISKNSILQYDTYKNIFTIITPNDINIGTKLRQYDKCGIDIGVRTFLTVYSPEVCYEIGTNTNKVIDKINKRLDKIKSNKDELGEIKYKSLYTKYYDKLHNKIKDMHNKAGKFILSRFSEINIGKVSIRKMVSNLTGNLYEIVKRRLIALSHFRFRMKLQQMKEKFNNKINEIDEYLTSKTCCKCGNINKKLGTNKVYNCNKCKLTIDRDINASINIYKI